LAATQTSAESERGVVAAGHPDEVAAGLAMLEAGGNAIDALVAAVFIAYVVEPAMCGIGGYGRLTAYVAACRELISVDHYLRAPGAARPDMFEIDDETESLKHYETPYTNVPNGVPRIELRLPLLLSEGVGKGRLSLEQFVALAATNAARIYGLYPRKGTIAVGSDADIVIWDQAR
jgi:gamma-glutamyltranspeptidase